MPSPTEQNQTIGFRFLDLPVELQDLVLINTDLILPWEVVYKSYGMESMAEQVHSLSRGEAIEGCTCWEFPLAIFQTSRYLHQRATEIFYSKNQFVLWEDKTPPDGGFIRMLSNMSAQGLRYIKHLIIRIAPMTFEEPFWGNDYAIDWQSIADLIVAKMNVPSLHLVVDSGEYDEDIDHQYDFAERKITAYLTYTSLMKMAKAFAPLKGLRKFHLFIALELVDGIKEYDEDTDGRQRIIRIVQEEEKLEKMVMGENYNSMLEGKYGGSFEFGLSLPFLHSPLYENDMCEVRRALLMRSLA